MSVPFTADGPGTPEPAWTDWRAALPGLDTGALRRLVVLAAHPDDETLVAGGLLAVAAGRQLPVRVVVATNGEASHPRSPSHPPGLLARLRADEVRRAVARVAPGASVLLLGLPDGALAEHTVALETAIAAAVGVGDTVVSTWRLDGHPDHEALGRAAAARAEEVGATLLEAPIWALHWGDPAAAAAWPAAVRLDLDADAIRAKAAALGEHASQTSPLSAEPGDEALLGEGVLAHFTGASEVFFPSGARAVDFDAMYAASDDPWGFEERWYEQRKRAVTMAALPAERYRRGLEIGCSIGVLTELLARRCDALVATDVAARAVELARARLRPHPHVAVEQRRLPEQWPAGEFDLVVLSETGFYLAGEALVETVDRARAALAPGGVLLVCHWRPLVVGLDRDGDEVHAVVRERMGTPPLVRHEEDDFLLEVFAVPPALSVARATGLR